MGFWINRYSTKWCGRWAHRGVHIPIFSVLIVDFFLFRLFFLFSTKQKSKQVRKKRVADVITENNDEYTISLMGSSSTYQSDNTVHNIYHESAIWLVKYFHQANSLILWNTLCSLDHYEQHQFEWQLAVIAKKKNQSAT